MRQHSKEFYHYAIHGCLSMVAKRQCSRMAGVCHYYSTSSASLSQTMSQLSQGLLPQHTDINANWRQQEEEALRKYNDFPSGGGGADPGSENLCHYNGCLIQRQPPDAHYLFLCSRRAPRRPLSACSAPRWPTLASAARLPLPFRSPRDARSTDAQSFRQQNKRRKGSGMGEDGSRSGNYLTLSSTSSSVCLWDLPCACYYCV